MSGWHQKKIGDGAALISKITVLLNIVAFDYYAIMPLKCTSLHQYLLNYKSPSWDPMPQGYKCLMTLAMLGWHISDKGVKYVFVSMLSKLMACWPPLNH